MAISNWPGIPALSRLFMRKDTGGRPVRRVADHGRRSRSRVLLTAAVFALGYTAIAGRLLTLAVAEQQPAVFLATAADAVSQARPDIRDRNGVLLATDIRTPSLYAEPHRIYDVDEAIELLTAAVPDLDAGGLRAKLKSDKRFVWLKRELSPEQRDTIHNFGLPGIGFIEENRRFYPSGRLTSHVVGHVNIDNAGIAGMEKHIDTMGLAALHDAGLARDESQAPVTLTLDVRVQHALRDEIMTAMETFSAKAGAGVVLNVHTGEVLALVSLPDYDPNEPATALEKEAINRITAGVYELGSTFKAFTVAMALDSGTTTIAGTFDATHPIQVGRFTINDFHAQARWLTVPEIFRYSSNIGSVRMALAVGTERQQAYLRALGLLDPAPLELPEVGSPLVPSPWREINTMTISFGHGLAVSPVQLANAVSTVVNGGIRHPATLVPRDPATLAGDERVISEATSDLMRRLLRLVVTDGTGRNADAEGYLVGGKTGTAEKPSGGGYNTHALISSFVAAFPMNDPRYVVFIMLDEPHGTEATYGYATGGWVAAPTVRRVIERMGPLYGIAPVDESAPEILEALTIPGYDHGHQLAAASQ